MVLDFSCGHISKHGVNGMINFGSLPVAPFFSLPIWLLLGTIMSPNI